MVMEESKKTYDYTYRPKEDITTYELALITRMLVQRFIDEEEMQKSPHLSRHFERKETPIVKKKKWWQ